MSEWREVTLGDLCDRVTVGHVGKMVDEYVEDGVPFLRSQNVKPFVIARQGMLYIGDEFNGRLRKSALRTDDVVVIRTGYPGTAAVVPAELDGSNCADLVVITPSEDLNPHMLAAVFNSAWGRSAVGGQLVGSAQQHFNVGSAKALRVRLPGRRSQDRIAGVLCALNELIENYLGRVEVLEEMAKAVYREWFVHFRYPGHEDVNFVDSPLGPIPNGWEVSTCGEELVVLGGGTPSKNEPDYWEDGTIPWFTPSDLTKRPARFAAWPELKITEVGLAKSSARLFPKDSVLMTSRATLGVLAIASSEASCNQGFIVIPPDRRWPPSFIYEWLDSQADDLAALGTGATFKEITKGAFKKVPFLLPEQPVLDAFRAVVDPIDSEIQTLEVSKRNLTSLRDLLLPKLVTGQIDVSSLDLDAAVEASVA